MVIPGDNRALLAGLEGSAAKAQDARSARDAKAPRAG
jgi:hypothetical protein